MDFNIISPKTNSELLEVIGNCQDKKFIFGAGYTDLINDLKNKPQEDLTVINLAQLQDETFKTISVNDKGIRIGALVTATQILNNDYIKTNFPVLWEATNSVASSQIRETATVGGNICQASPSGDMSCALVALNAICEIIDSSGNSLIRHPELAVIEQSRSIEGSKGKVRTEKLSDFFKDVKKTTLNKNEILRSIFVPVNLSKKIKSGYLKIGTRLSMEISIAAIAYHFQMDTENKITHAGLSIGAVSPVIRFTDEACDYLIGKNTELITNEEINRFAGMVKKYASPISDLRASAWYRNEVLYNSTISIFDKL